MAVVVVVDYVCACGKGEGGRVATAFRTMWDISTTDTHSIKGANTMLHRK